MDSWMATELDVILCEELIERECLEHLPFFECTKKEWRDPDFWGRVFCFISDEEWESQTCTVPWESEWKPHPSYNPWPWCPGPPPSPEEVAYWEPVNGVRLSEAELQAWARFQLSGHWD